MKTLIHLANKNDFELPLEFRSEDIRFPESFVRLFLEEYTKPGDVVFDPFAGYGTTLRVAESMQRIGYGTEYDERKVVFARPTLTHPDHLILGDAMNFLDYDIPVIDFSITSPIYVHYPDENPFHTALIHETPYHQYLYDLQTLYRKIQKKLKIGSFVAIELANLRREDMVTPFAFDVGRSLSEVFHFMGEVVVDWEGGYGYGYDHSYVLLFRNDTK